MSIFHGIEVLNMITIIKNNAVTLYKVYYVLSTVLSASRILNLFNLHEVCKFYYYSCFADKTTEALTGNQGKLKLPTSLLGRIL